MKGMIFGLMIFSLSTSLFAISDTATLKIQGKVDAVSSITFQSGDSIDRTVNILQGENQTFLDKAREESNSHTGYSVFVRSANKGLKHDTVNVNYGYNIIYGNSNIAINSSSNGDMKILEEGPMTQKVTKERDVKINLDAHADAPSGNYQDTLTFTLSTNG